MERIAHHSPRKVQEITWMPQDQLEEAARPFAQSKPAVIQWDVAIEQQNNSAYANRALFALLALTGNLCARESRAV